MALLAGALGRRRDVPQLENAIVASAAAGSAADLEQPLGQLPDMQLMYSPSSIAGSPSGTRSLLAINRMSPRQITAIPQATLTAASAANTFDWRVSVFRGGVRQGVIAWFSAQVVTTSGAVAVVAANLGSPFTITPASMAGIFPGSYLLVDTSTNQEPVYVISTTATTLTTVFAKAHATGVAVVSSIPAFSPAAFVLQSSVAPAATIPAITAGSNVVVTPNAVNGLSGMYGIHVGDTLAVTDGGLSEIVTVSVVSATQFTATFANSHGAGKAIATASLANKNPFELQGGDVLTIARVSSNATGLATSQTLIQMDWASAGLGMGA